MKFTQDTCCTQTARWMRASWESSEKAQKAAVLLTPDPGFPCTSTLDASGIKGALSCGGLLQPSTDYVAALSLTVGRDAFRYEQKFKTMGNRLADVKWFTEFENPTGDPLACAAASIRIVQNYTAKQDPMTAEQILAAAKPYNKSRDPGLDPGGDRDDPEAARPEQQLSLLPLRDARGGDEVRRVLAGAEREAGARHLARGAARSAAHRIHRRVRDLVRRSGEHDHAGRSCRIRSAATCAPRRRTAVPTCTARPGFQTGQPLGLDEWYGNEWWMRFTYAGVVSGVNIDRNDGAYPAPHWAGQFVLLVDDGDAEWPSDREGRVKWV